MYLRYLTPLVAFVLLVIVACAGSGEGNNDDPMTGGEVPEVTHSWPVFIDIEQAGEVLGSGATILDARETSDYEAGHLPGAVSAPWQDFVPGEQTGLLESPDILANKLAALGVSNDAPVVIYGKWNDGWGEEGRILWMLEYLGHERVSILEGGIARWEQRGGAIDTRPVSPVRGTFTPKVNDSARVTAEELIDVVENGGSVVILDTRDLAEYDGATPYGSDRGGRVPGSQHFFWKDVFEVNGDLRSPQSLEMRFSGLGIKEDTVVIAYCTGGVRSGFMYAVMRHAGYAQPQNYDGSWWEWSSRSDTPIHPPEPETEPTTR